MTFRADHNRRWLPALWLLAALLVPAGAAAQVRPSLNSGVDLSRMTRSQSPVNSSSRPDRDNTNNPFGNDTTQMQTDTSATKGLIFNKEVPDSVLRQKVFLFRHRTARVWIDEVWSPTLDPTGVQFCDPVDALDGNYYIGKGSLGHPHLALFPTLADGLARRLQPDLYPAYAFRVDNSNFFQTLTPFSMLSYGGSLADDHSLRVSHTQNLMPGWNVAFDYRLLNPEGVYASSGALNNYLNATTNYFSADSRLQASGAIVWQSFTIDENGGLANDSIFILRQQTNRAGVPVVLSNNGTLQRDLAAMGSVSYSLTRQSDTYRHRDSLHTVQVNDSTTRIDTLDAVDTIPLRRPRVVNPGVVGLELNYDRQKRVFHDSTLWREQRATLYWTNDAYADHRWRNPLKLTVGLQPRYLRAVVGADTLRSYTWLNPFARLEGRLGRATLTLEAEQSQNTWSNRGSDSRLAASLRMDFDSAQTTYASLGAILQDKAPDALILHDAPAMLPSAADNIRTEQYTLRFRHREVVDLDLKASHLSHHVWYDTVHMLHRGDAPFWLLQARLTLRLALGPMHLDMQQLLQHSTDEEQMPLPLWMTKNSLYADFPMFGRTLRVQTGVDVRYHSPYHAPLYDPQTGLFLRQDDLTVGGYLWADVFVNLQVKRASIYLKAGHVNALWETPATYFLLPHYPGQRFGLMWGLSWCFFD